MWIRVVTIGVYNPPQEFLEAVDLCLKSPDPGVVHHYTLGTWIIGGKPATTSVKETNACNKCWWINETLFLEYGQAAILKILTYLWGL